MSLPALAEVREQYVPADVHPAIKALSACLKEKIGDALCSVLFYGSCLRGGDPFDGLVDLYVIVDSYRTAYRRVVPSIFNWLLPPNVYYLEAALGDEKVRAKYAVVSRDDFKRGTSNRWFHSYLWARFAQPVGIVYFRDQKCREEIFLSLGQSVTTFIERTLPVIPIAFDDALLWREGLMRTYRAELRVEKKERTAGLIEADRPYYEAVTRIAMEGVRYPVSTTEKGYTSRIGWADRQLQRVFWGTRSIQGKFLSLMRLVKAAFTFDGGLDYIVWKLERHSGQRIEVPDYVRRAPLLFAWGLFWRLYRKGVFR